MNDTIHTELSENSSLPFDLEDFIQKYIRQNDPQKVVRNSIAILLYSIIFVISLFGNSFVFYMIFRTRQMRTVTNYYIANLTFSDIMMTLINIPFNTARLLLDDWPFGHFLCKCLPFIQAMTVYVSTITMCIIGLDRHQAILHPFGKRLSAVISIKFIIGMIWIVSGLLSIPHAYYNEVEKLFSYRYLTRCRVVFPNPENTYKQWFTILTFTSQYLIPLWIATICYCKIAFHIKQRGILGAMTQQQIANNSRNNRKTIKMLIVVLVVFAIAWLPLNLYQIVIVFGTDPARHNFYVHLAVHWFAMSSVCYNPFIYSIRNSYFRKGVKNFFHFLFCQRKPSRVQECETRSISLQRNSNRIQQNNVCDEKVININSSSELNESKDQLIPKVSKWQFIWKSRAFNETNL